jgi:hypothetical protein
VVLPDHSGEQEFLKSQLCVLKVQYFQSMLTFWISCGVVYEGLKLADKKLFLRSLRSCCAFQDLRRFVVVVPNSWRSHA